MNKLLKKQKKYNGILYIIIVAIIGMLLGYNHYIQRQLQQYARDVVEQNTEHISAEVDECIDASLNSIQITSFVVTQTMSNNILVKSNQILHKLTEQTAFDFIEYVDFFGTNTTEKGDNFDARDRVYYQEGMKGKTGILGADTDILPMLKSDFFDEEMIGILCDDNGKIISSTLETQKDAYLEDVLRQIQIDEENRQLLYEKLEGKDKSIFEFHDSQGKAIACIGTNKKTGWKIIQYVPNTSLKAVMRKNTSAEYILTAIVIIMFLGFLFYQVRKLRKEKDREVQNYENILLAIAAETYKGIRLLDLETGNVDYICFENDSIKKTQIGDWMTWLKSQDKNILSQDWQEIYEVLNIDNLRQMKEKEAFQKNYRSVYKDEDGYYHTYSTTVSMNYVEGKKTAIMSTIDNTEVVKKERKQKNLINSAASIYISMHVVDLKNDVMESLKSEEHINKVLGGRKHNVQELFREIMTKLTEEQFRDDMMKFVDFRTLDERMQGVNTITFEFLGTISGWCRARFIAVDYDENDRLSQVLWVIENIDKEKKKSNRLLYLSETDSMTGIRNRGSGERKIRELLEQDHQGMFCLLDADKFKSINDQFGHGIGDKVIIEIANCLKASFRENDIIMRLGGDEYAVFAEGITDKKVAATIIERFFNAITNIDIPELGDRKVTVSVGIAFKKSGDGRNFEKLYSHADRCAYDSKKIEGNAYIFFEE